MTQPPRNAVELLEELRRRGLSLVLRGDRIVVQGRRDRVEPALDVILDHKVELYAAVRRKAAREAERSPPTQRGVCRLERVTDPRVLNRPRPRSLTAKMW